MKELLLFRKIRICTNVFLVLALRPKGLVGFQGTLTFHFDVLIHLCHKICPAIALAQGVELKTFAVEFNPPTASLSLIPSPPLPPNESVNLYSSAPGRDFGFITILSQDKTGGLQVKNLRVNGLMPHLLRILL